jgi:hypothetical protein
MQRNTMNSYIMQKSKLNHLNVWFIIGYFFYKLQYALAIENVRH